MFEHVNKCCFCIEKDDTAKHFKKKFVKVDHKGNKAGLKEKAISYNGNCAKDLS